MGRTWGGSDGSPADTGPPAVPGAGGRTWIGEADGRRHAGREATVPVQPRRRSTQAWELRRGRPACRDDPHVTPSASVPGSARGAARCFCTHSLPPSTTRSRRLQAPRSKSSASVSTDHGAGRGERLVPALFVGQHEPGEHPQPGASAPRRKRSTARRPRAQLGPFPGTAPRGGSSRQAAIAPGAFPRGAATSSPGPRQARCSSTSHPLPASRGREPRRPVRGPGAGRPGMPRAGLRSGRSADRSVPSSVSSSPAPVLVPERARAAPLRRPAGTGR